MDIWVISTFWSQCMMLLWAFICKYLFESLLSIILGICPKVKFLDYMVILCLILSCCFSWWLYHFTFSLAMHREKAMAPHSSTLAWKIPWVEAPGRLQSMGSLRSQIWLSNFTFSFHLHALEKEMATHSSVLAWRIPGTVPPFEELGCFSGCLMSSAGIRKLFCGIYSMFTTTWFSR